MPNYVDRIINLIDAQINNSLHSVVVPLKTSPRKAYKKFLDELKDHPVIMSDWEGQDLIWGNMARMADPSPLRALIAYGHPTVKEIAQVLVQIKVIPENETVVDRRNRHAALLQAYGLIHSLYKHNGHREFPGVDEIKHRILTDVKFDRFKY